MRGIVDMDRGCRRRLRLGVTHERGGKQDVAPDEAHPCRKFVYWTYRLTRFPGVMQRVTSRLRGKHGRRTQKHPMCEIRRFHEGFQANREQPPEHHRRMARPLGPGTPFTPDCSLPWQFCAAHATASAANERCLIKGASRLVRCLASPSLPLHHQEVIPWNSVNWAHRASGYRC